ncbi:recombinase family protein [Eubacteriales bacterium SGI.150]
MRAFLYCRVAHDDSFALEHQRFLLQLYAKQAGYTIIGAADEYGSGLTLDRPAIQKVTEAVVAGRVDVVLVHSLTRIGREWGMTQSYICRILRSYKDTPHGPSGETRTPGILLPNLCLNLQRGLLHPLWRFPSLQQSLFETLLPCLFQAPISAFGICVG